MRIGFDAKRAFNNHRGLGNYSRETLRILTSLAPENQYYLFTPQVDPSLGYTCSNATVIQPKNAKNKLSQSLWRTFNIAKEVSHWELDLYHGLSHELPWGIEKTKTRTVLTMHDLLFLTHPELFTPFDRLMYRKKYLHSCQIADQVIAVSEQTKRDLLRFTKLDESKVEVVYQGCGPSFKEKTTASQRESLREKHHLPESFMLNVAAIEPRKNQLLILKAMVAGHIDMPLVIAGRKTEYLKEIQRYVTQHGIDRQVIVLPDFPANELPTLYQSATLFVFPSIYEGFGIPIIEALESGLPVIATTGSCLEESGGPDSLYVSPHDETELATSLSQLLNDKALRETMTVKGRRYAQRFSDDAICQQLIRIYKNLIP